MESLINTPGMPSLIAETLDADSIQNLAISVQNQGCNVDLSELALCIEEKKHLQRCQKAAFELMKRHRVAWRFKKMYPEFPQRFLYSLPCLDLRECISDYMDGVPNRVLGTHVAVCGIDSYRRPFVATKTTSGVATFINGRYSDDLSSAPRTGGDRSIFIDPQANLHTNEGSFTVVYNDLLSHCARMFIKHVIWISGEESDGDTDDGWGVD